MIDVQEAVARAKEKAQEILGETSTTLEEIDRGTYNGRDSWSITLSMKRDPAELPEVVRLSLGSLQYKVFFIDAETGELLALKIRNFAAA